MLACPESHHAPLEPAEGGLRCPQCGHQYEIIDGIPVLLPQLKDEEDV